jgi:hypothetical protein
VRQAINSATTKQPPAINVNTSHMTAPSPTAHHIAISMPLIAGLLSKGFKDHRLQGDHNLNSAETKGVGKSPRLRQYCRTIAMGRV